MGSPRLEHPVKPVTRSICYDGEEYNSILEAKWAYAFDLAGLEYEYEPRSFFLKDRSIYVPDFRVWFNDETGTEKIPVWVEAKGKLWDDDRSKMKEFAQNYKLIIVSDLPMTFCDMIEDTDHPWAYRFVDNIDGHERFGFGISKNPCGFGIIRKEDCDLQKTKSFYRTIIDAWSGFAKRGIPAKPEKFKYMEV